MKQIYAIEVFYVGKIAFGGINQYLLNVYEDQTVNVSTVVWWVMHLRINDNDEYEKGGYLC